MRCELSRVRCVGIGRIDSRIEHQGIDLAGAAPLHAGPVLAQSRTVTGMASAASSPTLQPLRRSIANTASTSSEDCPSWPVEGRLRSSAVSTVHRSEGRSSSAASSRAVAMLGPR